MSPFHPDARYNFYRDEERHFHECRRAGNDLVQEVMKASEYDPAGSVRLQEMGGIGPHVPY